MKMILIGAFLGFGLIVPGVSCTTSALIYNVYNDYIELLRGFYNFNVLKKHYKLLIGLLIGIFLTIIFINKIYHKIPNIVNSVFMGLMITGFIKLIKDNKNINFSISKFIIGLIIVFLIKLILNNLSISKDINIIYLIITGFITSYSFIIPGLSGGMILISFGLYFYFIDLINVLIKTLPKIDFLNIFIIFIFGISIVIGIIINSKIIKIRKINSLILGLIAASIILMFVEHITYFNNYIDLIYYIIILMLFILFSK